jgi:hypothetical protein
VMVKRGPRKIKYTQQIPPEIANDQGLKDAISVLPSNYNFEVNCLPKL